MDISSAWISNVIALIAILIAATTAYFAIRDRRYKIHELETSYINSLLAWHSEVVEVLMHLKYEANKTESRDKELYLCQLSALIESGRFYFPNIDRGDMFGIDKPLAYRGYRNLALDLLVASFNFYSSDGVGLNLEHADKQQRIFTSIVFEIVNPKERLNKIHKITDRYYSKKQSFDDLKSGLDSDVIKYIWNN